jgi:hypothetical protein
MLLKSRLLLVAALLIAVGVGLTYFSADIGSRHGLDFNPQSAVQRDHDESSPTDEEMERRLQVFLLRSAVKDEAVRDLFAGRLTLLQAAARFRDVEKAHPITWAPGNTATGPAEGERLCRVVMAMADGWLVKYSPPMAADVVARLEAELQRHRGPDGIVRLPD